MDMNHFGVDNLHIYILGVTILLIKLDYQPTQLINSYGLV